MNSLNILSARVSPPQTPVSTRRNSYGYGEVLGAKASHDSKRSSSASGRQDERGEIPIQEGDDAPKEVASSAYDEKTPLIAHGKVTEQTKSSWYTTPQSFANAIFESIRWVLSTLAAPGVYLMACMYNEKGVFSPFSQIYKLFTWGRSEQSSCTQIKSKNGVGRGSGTVMNEKPTKSIRRMRSLNSSSSGLSSESESDHGGVREERQRLEVPSRHNRSRSAQNADEIAPARRSIRIKLHNEDTLRQRKHRKAQSTNSQSNGAGGADSQLISPATLKSPTSPASSLLRDKYPRAPAPPRPLIPRRQPSYSSSAQDFGNGRMAQKTLILDLDETLIHSMAKGGRMSTGHMVEVKLNTYVGSGGTSVGPQHPILYYVHKRPHCDDFLRRICKWYNLVIFTASVQEYADPVIDWLEQERKFFSGRYYRQHCTYRHGAFIKDLSSVEPDLSKVMILDNSPLSYMFHQDNAIPIEGWINDPTDNDLLHLVPLLEGLQYVTDVRAFLALRGGEDGKHMTS